ncbi:MAG: hypothetical protein RSC24_06390 [Clostridium sp.]
MNEDKEILEQEKKLEKALSMKELLDDIKRMEFNIGYAVDNITKISNMQIDTIDLNTMRIALLATMVRQKNIQEVMLKILNSCLNDEINNGAISDT